MDKHIRRLSLDLLRGFQVAARHLSFTRAAQELCVTQSAISREIKTLEEQLGQPLFHRVNRALQLTHAGEDLYRATTEALALIDATAARLAGSDRTLAVTTTTALASTWLVPRLLRFNRLHPGIDVRIAATNDTVDIERENLDIAIRYVLPGADIPDGELLVNYETFPVCAPAVARDPSRPLRTPADLALHVRLDFETVLYGRRWYDWERWFGAFKLRPVGPVGTMRFSHYDQVIQAAIDGVGIAIGKRPHLMRHLREGTLVAPFGMDWVAKLGGFYIVVRRDVAARDAVGTFVEWLRHEVGLDGELNSASGHGRRARQRTGGRSRIRGIAAAR
jgi:DNA-binding transcriptional LysR family regulator